jgi:glutathione-specific gamma-glutamylcyclotransferase
VTVSAHTDETAVALPDPGRDPARLLALTLQQWKKLSRPGSPSSDLWLFGYASLIWRPEFHADEQRPARVHGWHRSLQMRSRINRGTPHRPGLVFALLSGGSCQGMVYRVAHHRAAHEIERLWQREMPTGVYDPRWIDCHTPGGTVKALAFTLSRQSPAWVGRLDEAEMLGVLREAVGRYGSTLDYLLETARCLKERGIRDREIERIVKIARNAGLPGADEH